MSMPDKVLDELNSIIFPFAWGADKNLEPMARVVQQVEKGGLAIPCFSALAFAAKCNIINRLRNGGSHNGWMNIAGKSVNWKTTEDFQTPRTSLESEIGGFMGDCIHAWNSMLHIVRPEPTLTYAWPFIASKEMSNTAKMRKWVMGGKENKAEKN